MSDRSDTSGLEQPVVSDFTVFVLIFIPQKEQKDHEPVTGIKLSENHEEKKE